MTKRDTVSISDKEGAIEVTIKMTSIIPSIRAIQQYEKKFQAKDIIKEESRFEKSLYGFIAESFNNYLYELIDEASTDKNTQYRELL